MIPNKKYPDDILLEKLKEISIDKYIHILFVFMIYFIFSIISKLSVWIGHKEIIPFGKLLIVISICFLKELYDKLIKKTEFSWLDFYIGASSSFFIFLIEIMR